MILLVYMSIFLFNLLPLNMCNELGFVEVKVTQTMNRHNPLKV